MQCESALLLLTAPSLLLLLTPSLSAVATIVLEASTQPRCTALLLWKPTAALWQLHQQLLVAGLSATAGGHGVELAEAELLALCLLALLLGDLGGIPQAGEGRFTDERAMLGLLSLNLQQQSSQAHALMSRCSISTQAAWPPEKHEYIYTYHAPPLPMLCRA